VPLGATPSTSAGSWPPASAGRTLPATLAVIRNTIIAALRLAGATNIANANLDITPL